LKLLSTNFQIERVLLDTSLQYKIINGTNDQMSGITLTYNYNWNDIHI